MSDLSPEALRVVEISYSPVGDVDSEPEHVVCFYNLLGARSDRVHNELETGGYVKEEYFDGESWLVLSEKGVKLSKLLRSFREL